MGIVNIVIPPAQRVNENGRIYYNSLSDPGTGFPGADDGTIRGAWSRFPGLLEASDGDFGAWVGAGSGAAGMGAIDRRRGVD
jgi:hypothetical protein